MWDFSPNLDSTDMQQQSHIIANIASESSLRLNKRPCNWADKVIYNRQVLDKELGEWSIANRFGLATNELQELEDLYWESNK